MNLKIKAEPRTTERKSDVKNVRNSGLIPGIIYGAGKEGVMISLPEIDFLKLVKKSIGEVAIFDIELEGKNYKTFLKDQQIHPVTRQFRHLDFKELHAGKPITIEIPLHYVGTAEGIKAGGLMEILHHTLELTCLPKDIPEEITIDVSNIKLGQAIHFGDIQLAEGLQASMSAATTLVAVRIPRGSDEDEVAEDEAVAVEEPAE
jgi:large subunit ribosomal protein L25